MKIAFSEILAVAGGGALGSVWRYLVGAAAVAAFGPVFPWGTLAVNLIGSAVIGALGGALEAGLQMPAVWRLFLITGMLGGFTTFSAFSLDTGLLWGRAPWQAVLYLALTICGGLGMFALCFIAARRLMGQ